MRTAPVSYTHLILFRGRTETSGGFGGEIAFARSDGQTLAICDIYLDFPVFSVRRD